MIERRAAIVVLILALAAPVGVAAAPAEALRVEVRDAADQLADLEGTFVVLSEGRMLVHHPSRAKTRFVPASTFKIANMMISLETGVASDPEFLLPWDGVRPQGVFWARNWSRDHTLRTALQHGVAWYFQEMARRIGPERMAGFVERFDYGNRNTAGPIDRFWLDGPLAISAEEQARFLERFHHDRLGLSQRTTRLAREILVLERTERQTLSGKTGTARLATGALVGWFVGYVEQGGRTHFFALNLDCPDFESCDHLTRRRIALTILDAWNVLHEGGS